MIYDRDVSARARREVAEWLTETTRIFVATGLRLTFPESICAAQTAWPEDCPLSEPELRAQIGAILADRQAVQGRMQALRERARALYVTLPEVAPAEVEGDLPQSVYYALTDALSCIIDDDRDDLGYAEKKFADTPASLRARWLGYHLAKLADNFTSPEVGLTLDELVDALCGDDFEATGDRTRDP